MTGSQFSITMLACFFLFSSKECQDFFLLSASDWQKMGSKNRRKNIWMYNIYMHNSLPTEYNIHAECLFWKIWISDLLFQILLIFTVLCHYSDVKRNWGEYWPNSWPYLNQGGRLCPPQYYEPPQIQTLQRPWFVFNNWI